MSEEQPSKIRPNTFQCPNALVDDRIMAVLTGNETKCYLMIVRKTFGWHKTADRIAKSQIMEATGLGETAVDGCMSALVSFGLVLRLAENNPSVNQGVLWSLQTDDAKVNWAGLQDRTDKNSAGAKKRTAPARKVKIGGVDEQPHHDDQPQVDEQPEGGVDEQPPQKPLSKGLTTTTAESSEKKKLLYPTTIPEAEWNPCIVLFQDVCGVFPGQSHWRTIIDSIRLIAKTNDIREYDNVKEFIQPYWLAWSTRTGVDGVAYNKLNPAWLTEWAVGGQIPPIRKRGQDANKLPNQKRSPAGKGRAANNPAGGERSEEELARARAAAERINSKRRGARPASSV